MIDNLRKSLETCEGTYCIENNFTPLFNSLPKSKKFSRKGICEGEESVEHEFPIKKKGIELSRPIAVFKRNSPSLC